MRKRFFASLLILCMVLALLPVSAASAETEVKTFDELTAALDGTADVIKLGGDINVTDEININRSVTLDLNGHALKAKDTDKAFTDSDMIWVHGGASTAPNVVLKNGTIDSGDLGWAILNSASTGVLNLENITVNAVGNTAVYSGSSVVLTNCTMTGGRGKIDGTQGIMPLVVNNSGVMEINGGTYELTDSGNGSQAINNENSRGSTAALTITEAEIINGGGSGVCTFNGGTVTINAGTRIRTKDYAISGNNTMPTQNIVINGGYIESTHDIAIYIPAPGATTINGGTITGGSASGDTGTGIYMKAGVLNIPADSTAVITGVGEPEPYTPSGDGANATGEAIVLDSCGYDGGPAEINIAGGSIRSRRSGRDIGDYKKTESNPNNKITISGGKFFHKPSELYIVAGKKAEQASGEWQVVDIPLTDRVTTGVSDPVVSVGDTITGEDNRKAVEAALQNADLDGASKAVSNMDSVKSRLNAVMTGLGDSGDIQDILDKVNTGTNSGYDMLKVSVYLEVKAKSYTPGDEASPENALMLDITPKYKLVAVKKADSSAQAVEITQEMAPDKVLSGTLTEASGEVTMTLGLPQGFAKAGDTVYICHNGYVYTAAVKQAQTSGDTPGALSVEFTNPHGFSTFVVTTKAMDTAVYLNEIYDSLQGAADKIPDGETAVITLGSAATGDITATVNKAVTIVLNPGSSGAKINEGMLAAGDKVDKTVVGNVFRFTLKDGGDKPGEDDNSVITVLPSLNGSVTYEKSEGTGAKKVVLTVKPAEGYELETLSVTDEDGGAVTLTDGGDGVFTFTMPDSRVTVNAKFKKKDAQQPEDPLPFIDVNRNNWFYEDVKYVYENNLFNGISEKIFAPNENMSRGMMAAVLYRMEGQPWTGSRTVFKDVGPYSWYADAISWASENKIVEGYGNGNFGPDDKITREQLAVMLRRYAVYKLYDTSTLDDLSGFRDRGSVSAWALGAMRWAVGAGIIEGSTGALILPRDNAMRAQVAAVICRFCNNVAE